MAKQNIEIPAIIQEIDYFLRFFAVNSLAQPNISFTDLFQCSNLLLKTEGLPEVDNARLNRIIDKLTKDGFISMTYPGSLEYTITYEGTLTHLLGGYRHKYLDSNRQLLLQKSRIAMETKMFWVTFFVALGTMVAAIFFCVELYWKYGWFHFSSH